MDDVDAVQAQIARNMLSSGDWVTAHLDGVTYLEKAPLVYWAIAVSYKIFGAFDWAARIPIALSCIGLCLVTAAFGVWAFSKRVGFYAGLVLASCVGLFLFTRILIPDVILTLSIAVSMWAFLRVIDDEEPRPRWWAFGFAACLGIGLLLKSLIAVVFPISTVIVYLAVTRQLFSWSVWKRLHPFSGLLVILAIAAPWHILATLRNPPYFAWTLHSGPGQYHGFLWFFFINEQLLRFLNMRYPRDYDTVPRALFWGFHLLWLFPFSVYFPALAKLSYKPVDRAGRARLLALCWTGFVMVFFTFSTTQEYYSMPCYPALALLLGCAMADGGAWIKRGTRTLTVISACCAITVFGILIAVHGVPAPGDISQALAPHPGAYKLSLGHMEDLTFTSFAYLRLPLWIAGIAFLVGTFGTLRVRGQRAFLAAALMMVLFLHAARVAMITFDPYLSSRPLAEAIKKSPPGKLIIDRHYYTFSSVFFYLDSDALLLNGRRLNLEYGGYAPNLPPVFIDDAEFSKLWQQSDRYYLVATDKQMERFDKLVAPQLPIIVTKSGGKFVLTNHPIDPPVENSTGVTISEPGS